MVLSIPGVMAQNKSNPVRELLERIDSRVVSKFSFELGDQMSENDYFALDTKGGKILVEGNNWVSVAAGLNWYLKYYAGVHISWSNPTQKIFDLPRLKTREEHSTDELVRYYLNYCTTSYSMAFWSQERWQQEIDFMALHGINTPLLTVGMSDVWLKVLLRLGYSSEQVSEFVAGPAYQAWWLMGNLEGWGGANPPTYYKDQRELAEYIVDEYEKWGMEPVLVGYGGMLPSFEPAGEGEIADLEASKIAQGEWCGMQRPAMLNPTSDKFTEVAKIYYEELEALYGTSKYYSMDMFHEGGNSENMDVAGAAQSIYGAMQSASPYSQWVVQAWQSNPLPEVLQALPVSGLMVIDLWSESAPQWGDLSSMWLRKDGFMGHQWVYSMLLNFGGNTGMFGKMDRVIADYYKAKESDFGYSMVGVGATMEAIGNNEMMFELLYELPWRATKPQMKEWLESWVKVRYGRTLPQTLEAWQILGETVYNAPYNNNQQGTSESIFCARPSLEVASASSWGTSEIYYDSKELVKALELMVEVSDKYRGCDNFEYDIVELAAQVLSNYGAELLEEFQKAFDKGYKDIVEQSSNKFLNAMILADNLLNSHREFMVGSWINDAMTMGKNPSQRDWLRWNARTLISTWGDQEAANKGGLRDYSHRLWGGITKDLYYKRWKFFFDYVLLNEELPVGYDYYDIESSWAEGINPYDISPSQDAIDRAKEVLKMVTK